MVIMLFLLVSSFCFAQGGEEAEFIFAKKAFSDGFYALAQENIEDFLDKYPETPRVYEVRLLLGRCFYYQNNFRRASYEFNIVLDSPSAIALQDGALYWIGDIYYRGGDYKKALEYYQKILDEYPMSKYLPYALYSKGWSYYRLGFLEDSTSIFGDVVSLYPLDRVAVDSLFKIGENEYLSGRLEDAQNYLNSLIDKYPLSEKTADSYYLLGDISLKQKKYADSLVFLKRAISISPNAKWADLALFRTAQAYFSLGDFDESIKRFGICANRSSSSLIASNSLLWLAYCYEKKSMAEEALKLCDSINIKFPRTAVAAESRYVKARILCENSKLAQAEDVCLASIDKFLSAADTGKLHYQLGWIYLKENKAKDALAEFKIAVKNLESAVFTSSALCKIGDIYLDGGDYDNAANSFDDSLREYPDSPYADYAQYRLGDIFLTTKKYDLAILAYQSLLVNFPQTALKDKAMLKLGVAYLKNGLFAQAMAEFDRVVKLSPKWKDDTAYKFYMANILYNTGKYDEALEIFKTLSRGAANGDISLKSQYQIGWCYYRMNKDMEAVDSFSVFSKKYPGSELSPDALDQGASILLNAAENFEKWKMPDDAARMYKKLKELKQ
ncbi:MAG: tetratricopeptide repeat protein [Candidatus Omnitrophota bacterium]|nr:tetratricopeptide repeat protein [Candidatus Omnitrophota bacterium]